MDATSVYPNATAVVIANGLGVGLAGNDPDHVPLEPDLINDSRRRFAQNGSAVDASGVMRLLVRNTLGYAFLRPYNRNKLKTHQQGSKMAKEIDWTAEISFYRVNYRHFVPHHLLMDFLVNENPPQEDGQHPSKWQGNAIAGVDCGQDGHVVFYPTGHILQQACAWYSKGESEGDPACLSTVLETGTPIRQFTVMGSKDAYHSTSAAKIYAATRGTTNCTIVAAPARVTPDNVHKMQAKAKISFSGMLNHIAGSPHTEAELALVTADGIIRCWDPEGGIQAVNKDANMPDRFRRCEYSSHPRVLWAANRVTLSAIDLRQPARDASKLFDVAGVGTYVTIFDVKRRASNPFQFVVGTGISVELLDSRMGRQPLVSWAQPQSYSGENEFSFGAIDAVDLSRNASDSRGYIISSSKRPKVTTLFPFERNRKRKRGKVLSLISLRSSGDDDYSEVSCPRTEQIVASDATLDLHMDDGGEYTHLTGICALRDGNTTSASIYQLNSLGDLFSHRVSFCRSQTKSYHTAIQPDLLCGVTTQDDATDESLPRTLPIPLDAILPEHSTESMQMFTTFPIKVLRRQFPRLPKDEEESLTRENHEEKHSATTNHSWIKNGNKDTNSNTGIIHRFRPRRVEVNNRLSEEEGGSNKRERHEEKEKQSAATNNSGIKNGHKETNSNLRIVHRFRPRRVEVNNRLSDEEEESNKRENHEEKEKQSAVTNNSWVKNGHKETNSNLRIVHRFRPRRVDANSECKNEQGQATASTSLQTSGDSEGGKETVAGSGEGRSQSFDKDELTEKLLGVCDPSASLFRLHRYVIDKLKIELSSSDLLQLLRSSNEFRIRTVRHALPTNTIRVRNPSLPGADDVHYKKDDPRIAMCKCRPGSPHLQLPCKSWTCVIPHAVIVSSASDEIHLDDTAPTTAATQEMPQDLADIIVAAHAVYDDMSIED